MCEGCTPAQTFLAAVAVVIKSHVSNSWADQIGEEALPLLVQHLDTDNDDRISFDEFMVTILVISESGAGR